MPAEHGPVVVFRLDRHGVAHACVPGWATAFCGAQTRMPVDRGVPCPRCMAVAIDRAVAVDAAAPT